MDSFVNFYDNLSSSGILFFWLVVVLFIFLIVLSVVLIIKNKKLINSLKETNTIKEEIEENIPVKEEIPEKNIILDEIKEEPQEDIKIEENNDIEKKVIENNIFTNKEEVKEEKIEEPKPVEREVTGLYQKNILREMNKRTQTSPISIVRKDIEEIKEKDYDDFLDTIKEESMVSPLEEMEDVYDTSSNMNFTSEVAKKLEEESSPSNNIELTDYERKQEEEAIISYDELLKVKDKIYNITDDEESDEFIDELKNFRLDLE